MKLKKLVALLLAALMVLGTLSACGGTGTTTTTDAPDEKTTAGPEETTEEQTPDYSKYAVTEPTTIQFWYNGKANESFYTQLINEFNELSAETNVTVVGVCPGSYDKIKDQFTAANQSEELDLMPGLLAMNFPATPMYYSQGTICDVSELLEANGFDWNDILDGLVDQVTVGDAIVAVPWGPSATSYYYNKTELAKHGLDDYPETWEEMKTWSKAVFEATGKPALTLTASANNVTNLIQSFGGSLQDPTDPTQTNLDAEKLVTFWKELKELVSAGYIRFSNDGENIDQTAFSRGDTMSYNISCTNYDTLLEQIKAASTAAEDPTPWFELGMAWNFGDGGLGQSTVAGCSLVVPNNIPQMWKNAAGVFLTWLVSPENQFRWAQFSSYIMIHESNITNPEVTAKIYETLPEMANFYPHLLDKYEMKPQTELYDTAMDEVENALIAIFIEGYDFDDTYNEMLENVEYILAGN